jgi:MYXO-CTERM domain-containing protein
MRSLMLTISALVLTAAPAHAASSVCGQIPEVLIVLDRSGSMKELTGTQSKWAVAKTAVGNLVQKFSSQLALGLMMYPKWPIVTSCTTGTVNVQPAVGSTSAIVSALSAAYPEGNTPIAATLDAATAYLATHPGKIRYVIFVSDGKETCLLPTAPLSAPGSCDWQNGTNFRKCGGCGWQFCLPGGTWSSACEPQPGLFTCMTGQTCSASATCVGTGSGSSTAKQAAIKLSALGIKTYVIGFGAEVDAQVLGEVANVGGTGTYYKAENPTTLTSALQSIAAAISCCGNGQLDPGELCDPTIAAGKPGACAASCDDGDPCTVDTKVGADCDVRCEHKPLTAMVNGDGCCPAGANSLTDSDCPASCGNGVLDAGETCDPKIPAGKPGACPVCEDKDPCTRDTLTGSACNPSCTHAPIAANKTVADKCCPKGLSSLDDPDCPAPCDADHAPGCVDLCANVDCADGLHCVFGKCNSWPLSPPPTEVDPVGGGSCDCRIGPTGSSAAPTLLLLLGLVLVAARRRR